MIVEFIGAPCSGKTTISHELVKTLKSKISVCESQYKISHGGWVKRVTYKFFLCLKYFITKPFYSFRLLRVIKKPKFFLYYLTLIASKDKFNVTIYEQGLGQFICSMFDEKPLKEEYVTYYFNELLPCKMDRILVYVKASCESINKRIEKRNDKTLIYHKQNSIERIIYVVDNIVDFWINRYGREKVYIVDNTEDKNLDDILKKLLIYSIHT